jgi:hypothetical protein
MQAVHLRRPGSGIAKFGQIRRADQTRAKKLQPPEAIWHSEGCCSPQNIFKISHGESCDKSFFKKISKDYLRSVGLIISSAVYTM